MHGTSAPAPTGSTGLHRRGTDFRSGARFVRARWSTGRCHHWSRANTRIIAIALIEVVLVAHSALVVRPRNLVLLPWRSQRLLLLLNALLLQLLLLLNSLLLCLLLLLLP